MHRHDRRGAPWQVSVRGATLLLAVMLAAPLARSAMPAPAPVRIPFFGARALARQLTNTVERLTTERDTLRTEHDALRATLAQLGALPVAELERRRAILEAECTALEERQTRERAEARAELAAVQTQVAAAQAMIVETEERAMLQEVGVYRAMHPLADAVAFRAELDNVDAQIKAMTLKDGGAIQVAQAWTVNGSVAQGRAMLRETSKLMLRAFNAEADSLIRTLKPYKRDAAMDRLRKTADIIARLGKTMEMRVSSAYLALRLREIALTACGFRLKSITGFG
jgi:hypothetical protein